MLDTIKTPFVEGKVRIARYWDVNLTGSTLHGGDSTESHEAASYPVSLGSFTAVLASIEAAGGRIHCELQACLLPTLTHGLGRLFILFIYLFIEWFLLIMQSGLGAIFRKVAVALALFVP